MKRLLTMKEMKETRKKGKLTGGIFSIAVLGLLLTTIFACNQDFPDLLNREYSNDTAGILGEPTRVLYIIVDGARGQVVQNANMSNLTQMTKHAVYTYSGIADYKAFGTPFSNDNGWANMLTGVTADKHGVTNDFDNNDLAQYPSLITRLKQIEPNWRTAAFCASDSLQKNLLNDATVSQSFNGDDKAVENATLGELNSDNNTRLIVAEFQGAQKAGDQSTFDTSSQQYVAALNTIDGYIGNLVDAIKAGKNYNKERWLVVVASNKGGMANVTLPTNPSVYDDPIRNSFVVFYSPSFQSSYAPKPQNTSGAGPYIDTAVHLYGKPSDGGINVEVPSSIDQSDFNIGTGALTVEAKIKIDNEDSILTRGNIPFLTKDVNRGSSGPGWSLWYNGGRVNLYVNDGSAGVEYKGGEGADINDGEWHTVGFKAYHTGSTISTTLYADGQVVGTANNQNVPDVVSSSPLRIGYNDNIFGGAPLAMHITDVRIWKTALSDNVIAEYSCFPGLPPSTHPNFSNLIGFWGVTKGTSKEGPSGKDTILDLTGNGRYGLVNGNGIVSWDRFDEVSPNICPAPTNAYYRLVPNSEDIPFQIFQWMGVRVRNTWGLEGRAWIAKYSDVTNPIF